MRKLPTDESPDQLTLIHNPGSWFVGYKTWTATAETCENAATKLAIELFKQGVLRKEAA